MREQPEISIDHLQTCLQKHFGFTCTTLDFLALGLDYNAGVYRVESIQNEDRAFYLLKVKAGTLYEPGFIIPDYLKEQGITAVVAPLPSKNNALWTRLEDWTLILYPFIEGDTSWSGMTDEQWQETGAIFKHIHQIGLPASRFKTIRKETFDVTGYSQWIRTFESQYIHIKREQPVSEAQRALLLSWRTHQSTITTVVTQMEKLTNVLQKQNLPYVICHADLHPANLLRDRNGHVHVIDWDEVMLAPKERDFIFVREALTDTYSVSPFFQGYGQTEINLIALTYYRYERVIQDVIECTREVFFKEDIAEEARADAVQLFDEVLSKDGEMEMARRTAFHLPEDLIRML